MKNCVTPEELKKFLKGEVEESRKQDIIAHLIECRKCSEMLVSIHEFFSAKNEDMTVDYERLLPLIIQEEGPEQRSDATAKVSDTDVADIAALKKAVKEKKKQNSHVEIKKTGPKKHERSSGRKGPRAQPPSRQSSGRKVGTSGYARVRRKQTDFSMVYVGITLVILMMIGYGFWKKISESETAVGKKSTPQKTVVQQEGASGGDMGDDVGDYMGRISICEGNIVLNSSEANVEANLFADYTLKAGQDSFASLSLAKEVLIYLKENSSVRLGDLAFDSNDDYSVMLYNGTCFADIPGGVGFNAFRIKAGDTIIYGPGSEIYISTDQGGVDIGSLKGNVLYAAGGSPAKTVKPGSMVNTSTGTEKELDTALFAWLKKRGISFSLSGSQAGGSASESVGSGPAMPEEEAYSAKDTFEGTRLKNWRVMDGSWLPRRGKLVHGSSEKRGMLLFQKKRFSNFNMVFFCKSGGQGALGAVLGYGGSTYCIFRWSSEGSYEIIQITGEEEEVVAQRNGEAPSTEEFQKVAVEVKSKRIFAYVDGSMVVQSPKIDELGPGLAGLFVERDPQAKFDSFHIRTITAGKLRF